MFPDHPTRYSYYEDLVARKKAQKLRQKEHWKSMSTRAPRRGKKR